jgi:hypothetical protein
MVTAAAGVQHPVTPATPPEAVSQARRLAAAIVVVTGGWALWCPSSLDGTIVAALTVLLILTVSVAWLAVLFLSGARVHRVEVVLVALVFGLPTLFTLTSPLDEITPGALALFACLSFMLLLDLRRLHLPVWGMWTMVGLHGLALVLGAALALDVPGTDPFFKRFYSAFYPQLLTWMLDWFDKPVLTFGTHSLAAYFYYLFFLSALVAWRRGGHWLLLIAAVLHLALMARLTSTAAVLLLGIAGVQVYWLVLRAWPARVVVGTVVAMLLAVVVVLPRLEVDQGSWERLRRATLGHETAGFVARYGETGVLAGNLRWLRDHPFEPVGFSYSPRLFYGDSGIVVYAVRGTVLLPVLIYLAFFALLWRGLDDRSVAVGVWVVTVIFEIGFTPLLYPRLLGFLPLLILWCNWWARFEARRDEVRP